MTLIKKVSLDGIENMELFQILNSEKRFSCDTPNIKIFGQKVSSDAVSYFE